MEGMENIVFRMHFRENSVSFWKESVDIPFRVGRRFGELWCKEHTWVNHKWWTKCPQEGEAQLSSGLWYYAKDRHGVLLCSSPMQHSLFFTIWMLSDSLKDIDLKWYQIMTQEIHMSHSGSAEVGWGGSRKQRCKLELAWVLSGGLRGQGSECNTTVGQKQCVGWRQRPVKSRVSRYLFKLIL